MAVRPILFSSPMVRAILDGRKTQTRRVLKEQPGSGMHAVRVTRHPDGLPSHHAFEWKSKLGAYLQDVNVPYRTGDRLWVRETWAVSNVYDGMAPRDINPGGKPKYCGIGYRATRDLQGLKIRPSIFMPRWASRLTLTVTEVRVERLQAISVADAVAEGSLVAPFTEQFANVHAVSMYQAIWNGLNADRGFGWDVDPWVVAVTFSAAKRNIDAIEGSTE